MAGKASKLDAPVETRSLIHQGTVVNHLLPLLKEAEEKREVVMNDPSLTICWPTVPGQLPDNTMVFARGAVITRRSRLGSCLLVFGIEGRAPAPSGEGKEQSLIIHAASGQAWVPPQS